MSLAETGIWYVDALFAAVQLGDEVGHGVFVAEAALGPGEVPGLAAADRAGLGDVGAGQDVVGGAVFVVAAWFSITVTVFVSLVLVGPVLSAASFLPEGLFGVDIGISNARRHGLGRCGPCGFGRGDVIVVGRVSGLQVAAGEVTAGQQGVCWWRK